MTVCLGPARPIGPMSANRSIATGGSRRTSPFFTPCLSDEREILASNSGSDQILGRSSSWSVIDTGSSNGSRWVVT